MSHIYELIKLLYFISTIFVAVFFLRGEVLFGSFYRMAIEYIMPGYLILCGIMIGYIIAQLWTSLYDTEDTKESLYLKSFIIGCVVGLGLALAYIFI